MFYILTASFQSLNHTYPVPYDAFYFRNLFFKLLPSFEVEFHANSFCVLQDNSEAHWSDNSKACSLLKRFKI